MSWVLFVFVVVYAGMMLGGLPGLKLDRAGVALLGAIALIASDAMGGHAAVDYVDTGTITLLFGLMILSAHLHLAGFYGVLAHRLEALDMSPVKLLAVVVALSGLLGALLTNDVIALALAPVLVETCKDRKLNPVPYLLGLACATNAGSVATIMGSPQNMLIAEKLDITMRQFLVGCGVPALVSLAAVWAALAWTYRGRFCVEGPVAATGAEAEVFEPDRWNMGKGILVALVLLALFLFTAWPRGMVALGAAGVLLMSQKISSRKLLEFVDWPLLVLFMGLFVVNGALASAGYPSRWMEAVRAWGLDPQHPASLFVVTAVMSDIVSNVPCVMLFLHFVKEPLAALAMAAASGLSSNFILIGSMANLIVVDAASRMGIRITAGEHARVGVPITLFSLAAGALWLWLLSAWWH